MKKYRVGYNTMWKVCPRLMERSQMKKPGSFDRHNHHGGMMPGWPFESSMTNLRASKVMRTCIQSKKLTYPQLDGVRKTLSYLFEFTGQKTKYNGNWPAVGALWDSTVRMKNLEPTKKSEPMRIPRPKDLRKAILKGWKKSCGMPFLKWLVFYSCFFDVYVAGARPTVDVAKIKNSRSHNWNWKAGWQSTDFVGGRSKLAGLKKGTRPWKMYKICLCKGKKHKRPNKKAFSYIDSEGNPIFDIEKLGFDPVCPIAGQEMIWQCQDAGPKRNYPNFIEKSKFKDARLGELNIGDVAQAGLEWMKAQGIGEFDHNAGRKSLARWCKELGVPYRLSVQIHGDLYEVWNRHYQEAIKEAAQMCKIRNQSLDPEVATAAFRIFARYLGRGIDPYKPPMTLLERQNQLLIAKEFGKEVAEKTLLNLPLEDPKEEDDSSEESDNTPRMDPKKKRVKKRKRRRKPRIKSEPGLAPPPPPKKPKSKSKKKEMKLESPEPKWSHTISCKIRLRPLWRGLKLLGMKRS